MQSRMSNLHPNECSQECQYYPFAAKLDRCVGSCNTLNNLSNKACIRNKTENLNLMVFKYEQSIYHTNISVDLMEKNVIKINGGILINVDVSVKTVMYLKKIMLGILLHVFVKIENI